MFVLGIDAGGSKTVCLLADGEGEVRRSARGPGANLAVLGELEVEKVLHELMEQVLTDERAGRPPRSAWASPASIAPKTPPSSAASCVGLDRKRRCSSSTTR